jgi:hypothetical protein
MVRILTRSAAYKVAARRHVPYSELPSDRFDRRRLRNYGAMNRDKERLDGNNPIQGIVL